MNTNTTNMNPIVTVLAMIVGGVMLLGKHITVNSTSYRKSRSAARARRAKRKKYLARKRSGR